MPEATTRRFLLALTVVMAALFCVPQTAPGKALDPSHFAQSDLWEPQPERVRAELIHIPGRHLAEFAIVTENTSGRTKWLSRDPLGEAGGLNLYGFVENDPINNWDYLGLRSGWVMDPKNPLVQVNGVWHRNEVWFQDNWLWYQPDDHLDYSRARIGRKAGPIDFLGKTINANRDGFELNDRAAIVGEMATIVANDPVVQTAKNVGSVAYFAYGIGVALPLAAPAAIGAGGASPGAVIATGTLTATENASTAVWLRAAAAGNRAKAFGHWLYWGGIPLGTRYAGPVADGIAGNPGAGAVSHLDDLFAVGARAGTEVFSMAGVAGRAADGLGVNVYWAGTTSVAAAKEFGKRHGLRLLDQLPEYLTGAEASIRAAMHARGPVHVFHPRSGVAPDSVWWIELRELAANPNVPSVTYHLLDDAGKVVETFTKFFKR